VLNFSPDEPLALVAELPCLDKLIKLDPMMVNALDLCFHYIIVGCILHAVMIDLCWC
jgi:hypothetical protein